MQRRAFITLLGGAAAAWPIATQSQPVSLPRIGVFLVGLSPDSKAAQHFPRGLRDAVYFEGRNVVIEWRYANGDYEKVRAFVDEFARSKVNVMVMDSTIGTEVAKRATSAIPIEAESGRWAPSGGLF
jgi:putative tryptophan/tyrosine transport system substrate-binding protein